MSDTRRDDALDIFMPADTSEPPFDDGGDNTATTTKQNFEDDLYKKWFRSKTQQGFLTVRSWFEAGKVSIEIGEVRDGGEVRATKVFTDAVPLAVYLQAVNAGRVPTLYPQMQHEEYVTFGGGKHEGKTVSRVLKIHHWKTGSGDNARYDYRAFAFKTGMFEGREQGSGAIIPNMQAPISQNMIKVSRAELAELSYRLDLGLNAFAMRHEDPFLYLNGNNR